MCDTPQPRGVLRAEGGEQRPAGRADVVDQDPEGPLQGRGGRGSDPDVQREREFVVREPPRGGDGRADAGDREQQRPAGTVGDGELLTEPAAAPGFRAECSAGG